MGNSDEEHSKEKTIEEHYPQQNTQLIIISVKPLPILYTKLMIFLAK